MAWPAETSVTPERPGTGDALSLRPSIAPLPSSPFVSSPQEHDGAVVEQGEGVVLPRGDRLHVREAVDGHRVGADEAFFFFGFFFQDGFVAELEPVVVAPRDDRAVREQRHAEVGAGRDRSDFGESLDFDRRGARVFVAGAQLAVFVLTPGHHGAVGEQGEAVFFARGDRFHAGQPRDRDRDFAVNRFAVAELARFVVAPGVDGAVGEQGEAVVGAGGDFGDAAEVFDQRRCADADRFFVAELAVGVEAPRLDGAAGAQRQAELATGGHLRHEAESRHRARHRQGRFAGTRSRLADFVQAPAVGAVVGGRDRQRDGFGGGRAGGVREHGAVQAPAFRQSAPQRSSACRWSRPRSG